MAKLALCDVRGLLIQVIEVLSGEEGSVWCEDLKRFLQRENPWPVVESMVSEPTTVQPSVISPVSKRWRDMGDFLILHLVVDHVSTGPEWIERTDAKGNRTNEHSRSLLGSNKFQTTPVGTYEVVVLKGSSFSSDPYTNDVREKAKRMKWADPNSDIACFIREQYSDDELKEMGLWWIVVIHEPIFSDDFSDLLNVNRHGDGRLLSAYDDFPDRRWNRHGGFAFLVPQVSLST